MTIRELKSILVASDFSNEALHAARRAALLAREHLAELKLMNVVREGHLAELRRHLSGNEEATRRVLHAANEEADALASQVQDIWKVSECIVRSGEVTTELLSTADHADLLVLGAHGSSPLRDALIGTTAERLLHLSRRPMLVVRSEPRDSYQRVFVAMDFSLHSMEALEFAAALAPRAQLHVFHAFEAPFEGLLRRADLPEDSILAMQAQFRDRAKANVENILQMAQTDSPRISSAVAPGNPKRLILEAASRWGAELIVLGKHGHSALGELLLGGVTRNTLSRARCDVAVVPPYPRP